jgi:glycosyltransferase involved in cell wall biosynthesis
MDSLPSISVQIPTYNQAIYIAETVNSVLQQDYNNLEIIIADDNSKDETGKIIENFKNDARVKYFKNVNNLGRVGNYHKSLYNYATGKWAVNLDGDDFFCDTKFLSGAIKLIKENEEENIVVYQANHNLDKIKTIFKNCKILSEDAVLIDGPTYFINYYKVKRFRHCATMFNREEALKLNFYSFDCLFTDFNSISKLLLTGKIIISGKTVAHWRQHDDNESGGLNEQNIKKEINSIEDIAAFAVPYFTKEQIEYWEKKMKAYIIATYIELLTKRKITLKAFKYILKNSSFNFIYFKQLLKFLIVKR